MLRCKQTIGVSRSINVFDDGFGGSVGSAGAVSVADETGVAAVTVLES
jgi:hypothetical protein